MYHHVSNLLLMEEIWLINRFLGHWSGHCVYITYRYVYRVYTSQVLQDETAINSFTINTDEFHESFRCVFLFSAHRWCFLSCGGPWQTQTPVVHPSCWDVLFYDGWSIPHLTQTEWAAANFGGFSLRLGPFTLAFVVVDAAKEVSGGGWQ